MMEIKNKKKKHMAKLNYKPSMIDMKQAYQ